MNDTETHSTESLESMSHNDSEQFHMNNVSDHTPEHELPGVKPAVTQPIYKSTQGQRARTIRLSFDELTRNEQMVVASMAEHGRPTRSIRDIAKTLNWHKGRGNNHAKGQSRVRNTLRRLVQSGWLVHESEVGDGLYRLPVAAYQRLYTLSQKLKVNPDAKDIAADPEVMGEVTPLMPPSTEVTEVAVAAPAEVKPEPTPNEVGF